MFFGEFCENMEWGGLSLSSSTEVITGFREQPSKPPAKLTKTIFFQKPQTAFQKIFNFSQNII
jgi:hypothetical protein